tara:strand:+ start:115 stop:363 length:249 start_codon:yes stop_codon:yes gene_type:complete
MEKEYNWKAILFGAIPVSIVMFFVFNSGFSMNLKWFYLVLGMAAALGITYYFDKKKHNIFTSAFVVVIVALIVHGLRNLNII